MKSFSRGLVQAAALVPAGHARLYAYYLEWKWNAVAARACAVGGQPISELPSTRALDSSIRCPLLRCSSCSLPAGRPKSHP